LFLKKWWMSISRTRKTTMTKQFKHIVLYDGLCKLCNSSVSFIIKYNKTKNIHFASLQSDYAKKILKETIPKETLILIENGNIYLKSTGALRIARHLQYFSYFYYLIYIPKSIRDFIYDLIAKNRYRVFGKYETCPLPDATIKSRFID